MFSLSTLSSGSFSLASLAVADFLLAPLFSSTCCKFSMASTSTVFTFRQQTECGVLRTRLGLLLSLFFRGLDTEDLREPLGVAFSSDVAFSGEFAFSAEVAFSGEFAFSGDFDFLLAGGKGLVALGEGDLRDNHPGEELSCCSTSAVSGDSPKFVSLSLWPCSPCSCPLLSESDPSLSSSKSGSESLSSSLMS